MIGNKPKTGSEDISILSSGVKIEGKFYCDGNVRIDGNVRGEIVINGNLTLGESCLIQGDVKAENITLEGKVEGIVTAAGKLILESKSVLKGDLSAKILIVEAGAIFDGTSKMAADDSKQKNEKAPEQKQK